MAINDFNIGFLGKLDGTRSKNQINQDIEALKKSLNSLEIKATLDPKQTQALSKQLNLLQVSLSDASFSPKALNDLVSQVNNALKGIQISNINTSTAGKSATQAGQQLGKLVSDSAEKAISGVSSKGIGKYFRIDPSTSKEFETQMKGLVSQWTNAKGEMTDLKINTKTVYDKDSDASFERLHQATVTYKNDLDEVTKKTIAWRQIGTTTNAKGEEEAIRGFVEVSGQYSKALGKASVAADTFADKQLKLKTSLSDSLNSIKSSVADQNASKPIKDQTNISSLQSQYQVVETAIANVGSASKSTYAQMEADARTQISVLQDMVKQYRNAENVATSLRTKDFSTVKDVQVQKLQEFKDRIAGSNVSITQMQTDLNNLDTALNGAFDAKTLTDYLNQLDVAQAKFKQLNTQIASTNRNKKVQIKVDGLQSNINEFAQLSTEAKNFKTTINGVEVSVQSLNSDLANVKSQGDFSVVNEKWKAYTNAAKAAGYSINSTTANVTKFITENRRLTTLNSFTGWVKKNSAASKTFATDINSIFDRLRNNLNMTDKEFDVVLSDIQKLQIASREANKIGFSFGDKLKNAWQKFGGWSLATSTMIKGFQSLKDMVSNVKELDSSLLELSKVSDLSAEGLVDATEKAYILGETVAKTGTEVLDAVTNFKRSGYEMAESFTYAGEALKMANISENLKNTGDNAQSIVNIMKGFQNESIDFAKHINDSVNQVSNTQAVDFDNLVDGATRLSAVGKQAGLSFEQMLGTLTGAYEVLGNMEKTATGEITIFSRLQAIQLEGEEEVSTVANLQDTFNSATNGAVDIVDQSTGQLRNVYDILDDVAGVWDTLDKNTQEALSIEAAGIRQKSVFTSMMANWDGVEKATESAKNSLGSADEENAKYLDSIEGRAEGIKSAFQNLSQDVINSDFLKTLISVGTGLLNFLDKLIENLKVIPILLGGIGSFALGKKNLDLFSYNEETQKGEFSLFKTKDIQITDEVKNALSNVNVEAIKSAENFEELKTVINTTDKSALKFADGIRTGSTTLKEGKTVLTGYEANLKATSKQFSFASVSMKALSSIGWMAAITIGTNLLSKLVDKLITTKKEIEEAHQEIIQTGKNAASTIDEIQTSIDSSSKSVKSAINVYGKFIDGVNTINNTNISLTNDDFQEFLDTNNEIAELFPTLVTGYDDERKAILNLGNNADAAKEKLQNLYDIQTKANVAKIKNNLDDEFKGFVEQAKDNNIKDTVDTKIFDTISSGYNDNSGMDFTTGESNLIAIPENVKESNLEYIEEIKSIIQDVGTEAGYTQEQISNMLNIKTGETGIQYFELSDFGTDEKSEIYNRIRNSSTISDIVKDNILSQDKEISDDYSEFVNSVNQNYQGALDDIYSVLSESDEYKNLSPELSNIFGNLLSNFDFAENLDDYSSSGLNIYDYLTKNLLEPLSQLSDEDASKVQTAYTKLLSIDPDKALGETYPLIEEYTDEIAEILNQNPQELRVKLGYDTEKDKADIQRAKNRLYDYSEPLNSNDAKNQSDHNKMVDSLVNGLSREPLNIVLNTEIPQSVLKGTQKDFEKWLDGLKEKSSIEISTSIDIASSTETASKAMSSLQKAFSDYKDNGIASMDVSNLTALNTEELFGNINGSTASYEKFLSVMQDVNSTSEEVQDAFDKLASAYLYNSELADTVDESTREYTESQLELMGVTNASAVVEQMLINKFGQEKGVIRECIDAQLSLNGIKLTSENASEQLANASIQEIDALIGEANAAGVTAAALGNLALSKIASSKTQITTDGDIKNLISLGKALGVSSTLMTRLVELKVAYNNALTDNAPAIVLTRIQDNIDDLVHSLSALANINGVTPNTSGGIPSGGGGGGGGGGGSETETSKEYDWIALAITRCEEALARLKKQADNTYSVWSKRNSSLLGEITKTKDEIELLQISYNGYMDKANSIGLSDEYKQKVQNGTIQIETITDSDLADKIDAYQQWWEEAQKVKDQIDDLNISLGELAEQRFDNIVKQFDVILGNVDDLVQNIDNNINLLETKGQSITSAFYKAQYKSEIDRIAKLNKKKADLEQSLNEAVSSGAIEKGSEAWEDLKNQIDDVTQALAESAITMAELEQKMREADWNIFDKAQEDVSNMGDELSFISGLINENNLTDTTKDKGLGSDGLTQMGIYDAQMNIDMAQANAYADEIKKINQEIAKDPTNQNLLDRKQELIKAQQDSINAAKDEKQAMIDLARQGYDALLDAMQKSIDKKKELLNSEKALYEYQKSIAEKTKNIAKLEKQQAVYMNDDSEEGKKKLQQLKVSLEDAKQDLKDTEYDNYISKQEEMMDKMYQDYSDFIDEKFENTDILLEEISNIVDENIPEIRASIGTLAEDVGYSISDGLNNMLYYGVSDSMTDLQDSMESHIDAYVDLYKSFNESYLQMLITLLKSQTRTGLHNEVIELTSLTGFSNGGKVGDIIKANGDSGIVTLKKGESVLTTEQTAMFEKLVKGLPSLSSVIVNKNIPNLDSLATPKVNNITVQFGDLNLPNVTNSKSFINELQNSTEMQKAIQSVSVSLLNGKSIKKLNRY